MLAFIIAIIAGYCTPMIQEAAARPVAQAVSKFIKIEENEMRLLAFMLAMLIAGIISSLFSYGATFWLIFGGVLGYFGTRLVAAVQAMINTKKTDTSND